MKIHYAAFASSPTTPTTIETSRARIKGTRWFSAPDATTAARRVSYVTQTTGKGKDKVTRTIKRITHK